MKTLLIKRKEFIEWFFDHDICKEFVYNHGVIGDLSTDGVFTVTAESFLHSTGYIPEGLQEDGQEVILNDHDELDLNAYDEIKFSDPVTSSVIEVDIAFYHPEDENGKIDLSKKIYDEEGMLQEFEYKLKELIKNQENGSK